MNKKNVSVKFYGALGKSGLSALSTRKYDALVLKQVERMLRKGQKVLDIGCGYGRVALPLLKRGYDIHGIDLCRPLVRELREQLSEQSLRRRFRVADMRDLPFGSGTFDVAMSLWSVFDELLLVKDQVRALREMHRVLKNGGSALIECHTFTPVDTNIEGMVGFYGHEKRIGKFIVGGHEYNHFNHDSASLSKALHKAGIKEFSVSNEHFGWRERQLVRFCK